MDAWTTRVVDHQRFKELFAVLMRDCREAMGCDREEMARRCGLTPDLVVALEEASFAPQLSGDLVHVVASGYQFPSDQLQDLYRVACVAQLIEVMEVLADGV